MKYGLESWNRDLFMHINAKSHLGISTYIITKFLAKVLIYFIPVFLIINWIWGNRKQRETVFFACLSTVIVLLINYIIGLLWYHPRPFVEGIGNTYLLHNPDSSFPSDHMTIMWTIGLCFLMNSKSYLWGIVILVMSLLTGWSRIFLGIHYPFDILGSIVISTLCTLTLQWLCRCIIDNSLFPIIEKMYQGSFGKLINVSRKENIR